MRGKFFCTMALLATFTACFSQQKALPDFAVNNINGKIIVSWVNAYPNVVTTLNIQRSFDSLKNFSTIGTVLSPQSRENGFADANPPYTKMYYRLFVAFEGGSYIVTASERPVKTTLPDVPADSTRNEFLWAGTPMRTTQEIIVKTKSGKDSTIRIVRSPVDSLNLPKPPVASQSTRVVPSKESAVILNLANTASTNYTIKFFDEFLRPVFELKNVKEDFLIIEKMNFKRPGKYSFEIYENGVLTEKNSFEIRRELKKI